MKTIRLSFDTDFYLSHGVVIGLTFGFTVLPALLMQSGGPLPALLPLVTLAPLVVAWREWRLAVREVAATGLTRHDGRHFPWSELRELREVRRVSRWGQSGGFNHLDLVFETGHARILPLVLRNGWEAIRAIGQQHQQAAASTTPLPSPAADLTPTEPRLDAAPTPTTAAATQGCSRCGELGPYHRGMQKHGREDEDTFLPPAMRNLQFVKDVRPGQTRTPELLRCPACGAWFIYEVSYEYLATGSEDDQELYRITPAEAAEVLGPSLPPP